MKRFPRIMLLVTTLIAFGSVFAFAEDDMMKQGMGGMAQHEMMGKDSMAMDKKMQELQQHEKMMEGIEDPKQMMTEMKKHMQMMGDMMGANCCKLGGMSGKPAATSGSGSMSEH
ncbi:MAG: hypothetical protein HOP18_27970 [Deltaproteobacteria bacterium]|nr:hypothetical protein [Deltaproteobacteria bacterium]